MEKNKTEKPQQEQPKFQFPTEEVTLPSKGALYSTNSLLSKGVIEMKYMTAKEEDILTNQNFIKNGTVINRLLKSLIVSDINYNDLLLGDKNAILIAARILGYGADYEFMYTHPQTGEDEKVCVNLSEVEDKELNTDLIKNGKNEFEFELPFSKILLTFKLLTHGDEQKIDQELKGLKKINKNASAELTTRLKHLVLSVNGDYSQKTIREFVDNAFLARDAKALRNYMGSIMPDADLKFDLEFEDGYIEDNVVIPLGASFFWPDVEL